MGAPTSGELLISNGLKFHSCNPSIVWSDDSRFLAVPQWKPNNRGRHPQRLMIVSIEHECSRYVSGDFNVLELGSFSDGVVRGVDSPAYNPNQIEVDTSEIEW